MKINSPDKEKKGKGKDYLPYILLAIFGGVVAYFFLEVLFKLIGFLIKLIINYWWTLIIIALILIWLKRRGKRKTVIIQK